MCRKCLIKQSFILKCSFLGAEFSDSECVVFDEIFHKTKVEFKRGASISLTASAVSLMEKLLSPSSCKAQGDSGSLVILKDLHLVPFFTKMRFNNNRKKITFLPSGSPTCQTALSASHVLQTTLFGCTEVWLQGFPEEKLDSVLGLPLRSTCATSCYLQNIFLFLLGFFLCREQWLANGRFWLTQ